MNILCNLALLTEPFAVTNTTILNILTLSPCDMPEFLYVFKRRNSGYMWYALLVVLDIIYRLPKYTYQSVPY